MMLFLIRAHEKATGMEVGFNLYGEERAVHMLLMRMLVLEMSDVFENMWSLVWTQRSRRLSPINRRFKGVLTLFVLHLLHPRTNRTTASELFYPT